MIREYGKGAQHIGGFSSGVLHDDYQSPVGVFDLRQELYQQPDGSFYLVSRWPYDFPGGWETLDEVPMQQLPTVLSVLEGPIGEKIRGLEIEKMVAFFDAGYTLDETAKRLCISPATVKRRLPILKAVLRGNLSVLSGEQP